MAVGGGPHIRRIELRHILTRCLASMPSSSRIGGTRRTLGNHRNSREFVGAGLAPARATPPLDGRAHGVRGRSPRPAGGHKGRALRPRRRTTAASDRATARRTPDGELAQEQRRWTERVLASGRVSRSPARWLANARWTGASRDARARTLRAGTPVRNSRRRTGLASPEHVRVHRERALDHAVGDELRVHARATGRAQCAHAWRDRAGAPPRPKPAPTGRPAARGGRGRRRPRAPAGRPRARPPPRAPPPCRRARSSRGPPRSRA